MIIKSKLNFIYNGINSKDMGVILKELPPIIKPKRRMEIMTESTDGFYISEQDLKLRGSGELFGLKQSGDEGFVLANLYDDIKILRCAREEGKMLLESKDPNKVKLCRDIAYSLERWSKYICFN